MTAVVLRDLKKSYGDTQVIHGVDLDIEEGEFVVFVGPSGCGKSTLLRTIAGLETSNSGTIHIADEDVTDIDPSQRGIAMVFQSYALYPHMTVAENMGFGLKMTGHPKAEIKRQVDEAARILKLEEYLDRHPKALSGGQRQRVAIGRAIVRNPKVFLFDEPLSNLDAELRVQMRIELAKLHKDVAATMIYVTHDQVEAMTLADKIVVLEGGYIRQVGKPLELYDNPANQFVAGFIGSPKMNFLSGKAVRSTDAGLEISVSGFDGQTLVVPGLTSSVVEGAVVNVGIRPEHFMVGSCEDGVGADVSVSLVENLGETSYAYCTLPDGVQVIAESRGNRLEQGSETLRLTLPASRALLFKPDGERLR
ncbi:carbohydrate ABC transporter ATP-binding protein, CUT1 family (TC 3.A.1.1.-) [Pseudovibrio ascidiaceicola]|uniref:Carbohydrate ABC transporter ATP-binding protein, CUT1 family (TC 3.A.1.1.-) n=1 Tax=Pseudovibrio ascidiaceicola TaxID=285279 RepID=A0A1I3YKJ6_9HYPH|nr:sn-glycerol-3-phosphate ABC transporter ATP-binding protein UgpC [Pseudovibrio ascidiaceicola]SFK31889.1 carbohydrate ABC transporter ATP-binding protein, CUT1 family (TC 3.A.1.1.-) [Pseudovibrio ascidiaceicola]